jgi:hypothetical protein
VVLCQSRYDACNLAIILSRRYDVSFRIAGRVF